MPATRKKLLLAEEVIVSKIFMVRSQKVMLDRDLAVLYGVETKVLKQAVRRNLRRFPKDFMFAMTKKELENWRSQFVTSNSGELMGLRYAPYCFTEQGVTMTASHDENMQVIFPAIKQLLHPPAKPRTRIGFRRSGEKD